MKKPTAAAADSSVEGHISDRVLEEYSLETLAKSRLAVTEHLSVCSLCRTRLEAVEPVNTIHFTDDGPIYSRATRLKTGRVMARHWGTELDGGRVCGSVSAAKSHLTQSFFQMFPEHRCEGRCGCPAQHRGDTNNWPLAAVGQLRSELPRRGRAKRAQTPSDIHS
jgi:hypothetical protein